jgi:hypothetical protein
MKRNGTIDGIPDRVWPPAHAHASEIPWRLTPRSAGRYLLPGIFIALLLSGCVTNLSRPSAPNPKLQELKAFYVIQNETDNRGVYRIIESELAALGKTAQSGPRATVPGNVDAVVTYYEDWKWDLTWYLLNLLVQIRDPRTNVHITSAASYRTSLVRTEPELMTREVLESIFK